MGFEKSFGVKLGVFFSGLSIACGLLVYAFPDAMVAAVGLLTHSTFSFAIKPFSIEALLIGAALWFVIGFVVGTAWSRYCDCCKSIGK